MANRSDDLAPLLAVAPPPGVRYGQGVILAWDATTFENAISWRGTTLTNVPILNAADALTYQVGDVVSLIGSDTGGASTWAILGRFVSPGSGAGGAAIEWMTASLARDLAAEVFADRVKFATVSASQSTTSTSFTDLATAGPSVSVTISEAGKALTFLSADILASNETPHMSFSVSGPSPVSASFDRSLAISIGSGTVTSSGTKLVPISGFAPGSYTFTAKYASVNGNPAWFAKRTIAVIAL